MSVAIAVVAYLVSLGLQLASAGLLYQRSTHIHLVRPDRTTAAALLRYGLPSYVAVSPKIVGRFLPQMVMAALIAPADLGQYAVAFTLSQLVLPASQAFGGVLFPAISSKSRGRRLSPEMRNVHYRAFVTSLGVGSLIGLAVAGGSIPLSALALGGGFDDVPLLTAVLVPGAVLRSSAVVLATAWRGTGRPWVVAAVEMATLLVTGLGLLVLLGPFGALGAAWSATIAGAFNFIAFVTVARLDGPRRGRP